MDVEEDFGPMSGIIFGKLQQLRVPCGPSEAAVGRLLSDGGAAFEALVCRLCEETNLLSFRLGLSFLSGSSFIQALLSFLANFGNEFLWELDEVLDTFESRTYLLDFLSSNLQLCRLERARAARRPVRRDPLLAVACELASLVRLPALLADPAGQTLETVCRALAEASVGPLKANTPLRVAPARGQVLAELRQANAGLKTYYEMRKQATLQRLDVTVKCFEWGARAAGKEAEFREIVDAHGAQIGDRTTQISEWDALLADREMLRVEKISAKSKAHSVARGYVIGAAVPDRGGRVGEGRHKMPTFKKREEGAPAPAAKKQTNYQPRANQAPSAGPGSNRGGGGGGGGGGGKKKKKAGGNKVKGTWSEEKKRPNMASSGDRHDTSSPKRPNNDK